MHNFIGLLTEKVDQMQSMIDDISLSPSIHPGNDTLNPSTSTEKKIESPLNEQNFLPDDFDPDELRFQASEIISNYSQWNNQYIWASWEQARDKVLEQVVV